MLKGLIVWSLSWHPNFISTYSWQWVNTCLALPTRKRVWKLCWWFVCSSILDTPLRIQARSWGHLDTIITIYHRHDAGKKCRNRKQNPTVPEWSCLLLLSDRHLVLVWCDSIDLFINISLYYFSVTSNKQKCKLFRLFLLPPFQWPSS